MTPRKAWIGFLIAGMAVLAGASAYFGGRKQEEARPTMAEPARPQEAQAEAETPAALPPLPTKAPAPPREADLKSIPATFHGEWNARTSQCGTDLNDSRLRITKGTVQFYESLGSVTRVKRVRPNEILVSLSMSGEGETWSAQYRFAVTPDGKVLTDKSDSAGLQRFQCA